MGNVHASKFYMRRDKIQIWNRETKKRSKWPANSENMAGATDLRLMDRGERKEVSFGDISHLKNQV